MTITMRTIFWMMISWMNVDDDFLDDDEEEKPVKKFF